MASSNVIGDYKINLTEEEIDRKFNKERTDIHLVSEDFEGYQTLADGDKKALAHLVKGAYHINDVFLRLDHHKNIELRDLLIQHSKDNPLAAKTLRFFNSFNGVEGLDGIRTEPIELFEGVKGADGRAFYPEGLEFVEFKQVLLKLLDKGEKDKVQKILSNRSVVIRDEVDGLKAIDYIDAYSEEFAKAADEFEKAAKVITNKDFAKYLELQAEAFRVADPEIDCKADLIWAELQDTELELTVGREDYNDRFTPKIFEDEELKTRLAEEMITVQSKDDIEIRVGLVNKRGTDLILSFKEHMKDIAKLMPLQDKYSQAIIDSGELKQTMVDVDLVYLSGDYRALRGSITTAQNLPNDDKLAVIRGGGRRNCYHRQVRMSYDKGRQQKIMEQLVDESLHKYFDKEAEHLFVIGHENGHSLGPDDSYKSGLGVYRHTIEENKANIVSISFIDYYRDRGIIDDEMLKKVYVTWAIRHFLQSKPHETKPHRVADLMELNYFTERGAFSWDEQGKLFVDCDKVSKVAREMLEDLVSIQLSKDAEKAKAFIDKYAIWGERYENIVRVYKELGVKNYKELVHPLATRLLHEITSN